MVSDRYKRSVSYINKDFAENRLALINYLKNYFPNSYQDFNESSPAMAFVELVAYVGDVLSFYTDVQLMESLLFLSDERINLYNLAQGMGYKAKTVVPASVDLEVFQLLPSIGSGQNTRPDFRYALYIQPTMQVSTTDTDAVYFYTKDAIDFRFSSSFDPTTITTYSVTQDGEIEYYLLKKTVKAVSGKLQSRVFSFSDPKIYDKIVLPENNVTEIVSVEDSDLNKWYEVSHLAQDLVPLSIRNVPYNDAYLSQYQSSVPYILIYKQTEHRFVTRLRKDDLLEIQFGAGLSSEADEEIIPNPMNVGLGLDYFERPADLSIDPQNFLYTKTYGTAPSNTLLTVQYSIANGIRDNVNANTITQIVSSSIVNPFDSTDSTVLQTIIDSVAINNPNPAFGGQDRRPLEMIRQEAMANFASQNRAVTKEDYILRCFTMPAKYGAIAKAYIEQDTQLGRWNEDRVPNPYSMNLYVLSYNADRQFVACNEAIKENLRQYLRNYRLLTDAINIKDCQIINFSIDIEVMTYQNENSNEVILRCIDRVIDYFDNQRMEINQPILISKLKTEIDKVQGVQTVKSIKFINQIDMSQGYSGNVYPIENAIRDEILYPSLTPSIFELRFPKKDVRVRVVES